MVVTPTGWSLLPFAGVFFVVLAEGAAANRDYDADFRSLPYQQLEKQKQEMLREYLLTRVGRLLELQEQQQQLLQQQEQLQQQQLQQQLQQQQLQQQLQEQQQQQHQGQLQPPFTFRFPESQAGDSFAVSPSDPRYYLPIPAIDLFEGDDTFARNVKSKADFPDSQITGFNEDLLRDDKAVNDDGEDDDTDNGDEEELEADGNRVRGFLKASLPSPGALLQVFRTPIGDFETTHDDLIFMAIVAGCSAAVVVIVAGIGFGWYRLHKKAKAAADVEYPAYGVTGPNKEISPTGDRKLAENAQMYHYQHQKQQIISMSSSRVSNEQRGGSGSEAESDEENEEGDYTVYECPGLAAPGEMEVKNPLFQDDPTPADGRSAPDPLCPSSPKAHTQK